MLKKISCPVFERDFSGFYIYFEKSNLLGIYDVAGKPFIEPGGNAVKAQPVEEREKEEGQVDAAVADNGAHERNDVADEEEAADGQRNERELLRRPGHGTGQWRHLAARGAEVDRCGCRGFRHRALLPRAGRGSHGKPTPPMS